MTTFEPGRIYSGVVDGKRQIIFRDGEHWHHVDGDGNLCGGDRYNSNYTDVRGPLVMLDLADYPLHAQTWRQFVQCLREPDSCGVVDCIADQIEEQTRPPLQVGVHLAWSRSEGRRAYMCWDGNFWWYSDSNKSLADWESIHYIGPASEDQS